MKGKKFRTFYKNDFHWFHTKPRFDKEALGNSELASFSETLYSIEATEVQTFLLNISFQAHGNKTHFKRKVLKFQAVIDIVKSPSIEKEAEFNSEMT